MSEETCINDWRGPTRPFINGVVEAKKTQWWSTTRTSDGPGPCQAWGLTHPFGWVKPRLGLEPQTLDQARAWALTHHYWWCCCKNTRFPCLLHYMYLYFTSCFLKRSKKLSCVSNNTILHMYWKLEPVSKKTCRYLLFIPICTRYFQVQIRVILASYIIL